MERARIAGKIGADRGNLRLQSLAGNLSDFVVLPPGFGYVAVGDYSAAAPREEASAENVELNFRPLSIERHPRISFAILYRLALLVQAAVTQAASRLLIVERD